MDITIYVIVGLAMTIAYLLGMHQGWDLHKDKMRKLIASKKKPVLNKTFSSQSI